MIDWHRVRDLREEVGEEAFEEVIELFLEEVEEVVRRLQEKPNPAAFEADLHFLKGSALNLGFSALGASCQLGESAAADGRMDDVDLPAILEDYAQSRAEFLAQVTAQVSV